MFSRWVLFAVLVTILQVSCTNDTDDNTATLVEFHDEDFSGPRWVYRCHGDEGCQRSPKPLATSASGAPHVYENVDTCRSVCGRFGGIWPRPLTAALSSQTINFNPKYLRFDLIDTPPEARELLVEMTSIFTDNLHAECDGKVTEMVDNLFVIFLNITSNDLTLNGKTNESYMLNLQTKGSDITAHISAETVYGARHGLETLSQLVSMTKSDFSYDKNCGLQILTGAKIRDNPVFPHRGFMLDTARNFIPIPDIKRTMDAMAASKMNVFHWHATDSQSFPLESSRVPLFTKYGAYSAQEVYNPDQVKDLLQYAKVRGIRVILEIDAPAHAGNGWQWGKEYGLGDLAVCVNAQPWRNLCIEPPCGQLNPANDHMYDILRELYRDIAETFPQNDIFHMGGDEVFMNCWNSSQEIVDYMKANNFNRSSEGFQQLWGHFQQEILKIWDEEASEAGATSTIPIMVWSSDLTRPEKIHKYLDKNRYIIEVWDPATSTNLHRLIKLGYRVVNAPKDVWYLDHGFWGTTIYSTWRKMYNHRIPRDRNVLGGEVAMWTEYCNALILDGRVWPRAAAVAERLWSDPSTVADAAEPRLQRHRTRLIARGIGADAISPGWCAQNENMCHR